MYGCSRRVADHTDIIFRLTLLIEENDFCGYRAYNNWSAAISNQSTHRSYQQINRKKAENIKPQKQI
jgi:hypothetical protein